MCVCVCMFGFDEITSFFNWFRIDENITSPQFKFFYVRFHIILNIWNYIIWCSLTYECATDISMQVPRKHSFIFL